MQESANFCHVGSAYDLQPPRTPPFKGGLGAGLSREAFSEIGFEAVAAAHPLEGGEPTVSDGGGKGIC